METPVFNPLSAEFRSRPYEHYRWFRSHSPVHRVSDAHWLISRHHDVVAVLKDYRRFPKDMDTSLAIYPDGWFKLYMQLSMSYMDPPDHTRVRGSVTKAFSPALIEQMEPSIVRIARELIAQLTTHAGEVDLIADFALQLPIFVMCDLMGIPVSDRAMFKRCATALIDAIELSSDAAAHLRANQAVKQLYDYLGDGVRERRGRPAKDLLGHLVAAERDGQLSPDEVIHNAIFLLSAGHETTTNLIGNGMHALLQHSDQLATLVAEPGLLDNAVHEFLRFCPPIHFAFRRPAEDIELAGQRIPARVRLSLALAGANRDPEVFEDPERLDVRRPNARLHLAFSSGNHTCLGNNLARLEGRIAFRELLRRFPAPELAGEPVRRNGLVFQGFTALPLRVA